MKYGSVFFLLLLVLPAWSEAAVQAGFPSQAIWVSRASAVEGETLAVSVVVYNSETETLSGTLVFTANDTRVGAREFELSSGESQIHSIEWKPQRGAYRLVAHIEGTSASLSQKETAAIEIAIADPPAPSPVVQAAATVSNIVGSVVSSSTPIITSVVESIYGATEAFRANAVSYLKEMVADNSPSSTVSGGEEKVLGAETERVSGDTTNTSGFNAAPPAASSPQILQVAAGAALFFFESRALFYLALILLALGILYWLARKVRRQSS